MRHKNFRLGIIGGGQLGKMMTQEAQKMGFYVIILDPTPNSPAGQVADQQIIADFNDEKSIVKVAQQSDYLTFEIENTRGKFLDELEKRVKCKINPSGKSWRLFQDKLKQKKLFDQAKVPHPQYRPVKSFRDLEKAVKELKLPLMLKSRTDSYDGRGNALLRKEADIKKGWQKLKSEKLYAEKFVDFDKELAIMVARSNQGKIVPYPVVETIQKNNICHYVLAPAQISSLARKRATRLAIKTMKLLKGAGVFGIEMFKTPDDKIWLNEISPRVHNSGHYTIEACVTSQFEQHVRAVSGLPLGSTAMIVPAAIMVNILGDRQGPARLKGLEKALAIPGIGFHLYGKHETRPERKMGHITVIDKTLSRALTKAKKARNYISI
jgi:5-(carboxyamino)imidazole ribonucleotide synthase